MKMKEALAETYMFVKLKVHLTPQFFFAKMNLHVIWNTTANKFWIRLNPRFSLPRRNLENSPKTPPFCFATEFEENGSSGCCHVYPGRSNISRPLISFGMVRYTFKKCAEMPSRVLSAVEAISQIWKKISCTIYWRWSVNGTIKT